MTQFVRVPARLLHHIPNSLPFEEAALAEPCCVAYHAACINVRIRPGDSVAVIGPGPIGLLCALMAVLSGADPLVVIGTPADEKRLQQAREIGAMHTLGADGRSPAEVVRGIGDGYGVDVVIDAAGVSASLKLALELVRPKGQIAKVGWGPQPCDFSLDALVQKEIMLAGSFSHNYPMWEKVVWMLSSGQIDLGPVLGMISPLVDWKSAFDSMQSGDVVKAVLIP
jgi:alcohol dehydrogenase/L-iditol 2-dehydrogenase